MTEDLRSPVVLRTYRREGGPRHRSATGEVGEILSASRIEVVWVRKHREAVDPHWFSLPTVDVLIIVRGRLRVEFADSRWKPRVLGVGDVLVLPPRTKCRAYRWPRSSRGPTIFVAAYPTQRRPPLTDHGGSRVLKKKREGGCPASRFG